MRIQRLKTALSTAFACVCLAVTVGVASEPWDFPAGFKFGNVRDAQLPDILERVRREHDLPALATVSVTSTGVVELAAVGLRAVGFRERATTHDHWHLGSIAKPMTATVAARLVDADPPPSLNPAGVVHASLQDVARSRRPRAGHGGASTDGRIVQRKKESPAGGGCGRVVA